VHQTHDCRDGTRYALYGYRLTDTEFMHFVHSYV